MSSRSEQIIEPPKLPEMSVWEGAEHKPTHRPYILPVTAESREEALRRITAYDLATARNLDRNLLFNRAQERQLTPYEIEDLRQRKQCTQPEDPKQYEQLVKQTFAQVFRRDKITLEDTQPERIRACWRIVREMARSKRLLNMDEPMILGLLSNSNAALDTWNMPTEHYHIPNTLEYISKPDPTVCTRYLHHCVDALRLKKEFWPWVSVDPAHNNPAESDLSEHFDPTANPNPANPSPTQSEPYVSRPGLPLLPPPVPLMYYTPDGQIVDDYDPGRDDPGLTCYLRAIDSIADYLGVYNGSIHSPDAGRGGMMGVVSPAVVRLSFPTKLQMIAWEYIVLTETLDQCVNNGVKRAYQYLIVKYGLFHTEANGMIRMARRFAKDLANADRAEDRAMMLLRCEELQRRGRRALDFKTELNAMKQMSAILGLTRTEEDESMEDFTSFAKVLTQNRAALTHTRPATNYKELDDPRFDLTEDE